MRMERRAKPTRVQEKNWETLHADKGCALAWRSRLPIDDAKCEAFGGGHHEHGMWGQAAQEVERSQTRASGCHKGVGTKEDYSVP